jgi:hypothetical protein
MIGWYYLLGITFATCSAFLLILCIVGLVLRKSEWYETALNGTCWASLMLSLLSLLVIAHELSVTLLSGSPYDRMQFRYQIVGPHAWVFWLKIVGFSIPQLFWITELRANSAAIFVITAITLIYPLLEIVQRVQGKSP